MDDVCSNLNITDIDYDVEFSMKSKTLASVLDKLSTFGSTLSIYCNENIIYFHASDVDGNLNVSYMTTMKIQNMLKNIVVWKTQISKFHTV